MDVPSPALGENYTDTDWWFGDVWNMAFMFPILVGMMIHSYFSGGLKPPTRMSLY
jgi:hypothetical protein